MSKQVLIHVRGDQLARTQVVLDAHGGLMRTLSERNNALLAQLADSMSRALADHLAAIASAMERAIEQRFVRQVPAVRGPSTDELN